MRQLSQLEYNLALSIVTKFYRDIELFTNLEAAIGMSWEESRFWEANLDLVSELLLFLGIDKEKFVTTLLIGYNHDNGKRSHGKAKDFLDDLLSRLNITVKIS
jgi:hypothetical protein